MIHLAQVRGTGASRESTGAIPGHEEVAQRVRDAVRAAPAIQQVTGERIGDKSAQGHGSGVDEQLPDLGYVCPRSARRATTAHGDRTLGKTQQGRQVDRHVKVDDGSGARPVIDGW